MKENDYIVRIWPSGTKTMGIGVASTPGSVFIYWRSVESYELEGGVVNGDIYGSIAPAYHKSTHYEHRLATQFEIDFFKQYGEIQNREADIKQYERNRLIDNIINVQ